MKNIPLCQIRVDKTLYSRAEINEEVVADYVEAIKRGDEFPPILVYWTAGEETYLLVDGFHRVEAQNRVNPNAAISAKLKLGGELDARWAAVSMNQNHGLRRSNADKRRAVELALLHPKGATLSNRLIARHTGVSEFLIRDIRKEMESTAILSQSNLRTGADGREIDTTNIGSPLLIYEGKTCADCDYLMSDHTCMFSGAPKMETDAACEEFQVKRIPETPPVPDRSNIKILENWTGKKKGWKVERFSRPEATRMTIPQSTQLAAVELRHARGEEWLKDLWIEIFHLVMENVSNSEINEILKTHQEVN